MCNRADLAAEHRGAIEACGARAGSPHGVARHRSEWALGRALSTPCYCQLPLARALDTPYQSCQLCDVSEDCYFLLGGGGPRVCEIAKAGIRGNFEAREATIDIGISAARGGRTPT